MFIRFLFRLCFIILILSSLLSFPVQADELILQEGLNSYKGTEDVSVVDPEAEAQLSSIKGADKEKVIAANYRC